MIMMASSSVNSLTIQDNLGCSANSAASLYKMKLDAMKRQGQRSDLSSSPPGTKLGTRSNQELANQSPDGKTQIHRYIRLTNLIPELLDMVDNSVLKEKDTLQMALRPVVELSYLTEDEQRALLETMSIEDCTPSHAQAIKMRNFSEKGKLNADASLILKLISGHDSALVVAHGDVIDINAVGYSRSGHEAGRVGAYAVITHGIGVVPRDIVPGVFATIILILIQNI